MIQQTGYMWNSFKTCDLFLVTTNAVVLKGGRLVMGAGIAGVALDRYPGLDKRLGKAILAAPNPARYGLLVSPNWPTAKLGAFQTKIHWRDPSPLDIIAYSTDLLCQWCKEHPDSKVSLNFPGIGKGKLGVDEVLPIISKLPDNVTVWRFQNTPTHEGQPFPE